MLFQGFIPSSRLNCDSSQKNSAVVIFQKEKLLQFFCCLQQKTEVENITTKVKILQEEAAVMVARAALLSGWIYK